MCSGRNKIILHKLKILLPQIEPAVLHGDGVGLPQLGHQHLHGRQQGAAQEDVWRGAAGAARAGGHARRHGKNIFMFPKKIFDHTKTMSGEDRLHSAAVHGGAAGHNSGLPGAKGKYLKIKIQCSVPKKHLNVTIVIRTLQ